MSSWKLVEAEAEPNEVQQQVEENKPRAGKSFYFGLQD